MARLDEALRRLDWTEKNAAQRKEARHLRCAQMIENSYHLVAERDGLRVSVIMR
jgi:hypothetical protein